MAIILKWDRTARAYFWGLDLVGVVEFSLGGLSHFGEPRLFIS